MRPGLFSHAEWSFTDAALPPLPPTPQCDPGGLQFAYNSEVATATVRYDGTAPGDNCTAQYEYMRAHGEEGVNATMTLRVTKRMKAPVSCLFPTPRAHLPRPPDLAFTAPLECLHGADAATVQWTRLFLLYYLQQRIHPHVVDNNLRPLSRKIAAPHLTDTSSESIYMAVQSTCVRWKKCYTGMALHCRHCRDSASAYVRVRWGALGTHCLNGTSRTAACAQPLVSCRACAPGDVMRTSRSSARAGVCVLLPRPLHPGTQTVRCSQPPRQPLLPLPLPLLMLIQVPMRPASPSFRSWPRFSHPMVTLYHAGRFQRSRDDEQLAGSTAQIQSPLAACQPQVPPPPY